MIVSNYQMQYSSSLLPQKTEYCCLLIYGLLSEEINEEGETNLTKFKAILNPIGEFFKRTVKSFYEKPSFLIALITAIVLVWQTNIISRQTNLYEDALKSEQKPILFQGVGEQQETRLIGNQLIVTEHYINLGRLPAYNMNLRYAVRTDSEYPLEHFRNEMLTDSTYQNILFPGIPRIDTLGITVDSNADSLTIEALAYLMYENNSNSYIHYWVEYEDVAGRFYILQQTFALHGRADSTLFWTQELAREYEYSCKAAAL